MNTKKFILFNILQTIVALVFTYKSFFRGFENETVMSFISANGLNIGILFLIFITTLFVNISFIVPRVLHKKNLLRISFIFQLIFTGYSIYLLFVQQIVINIILSIFLLLVLIVEYTILKNLFTLVRKIFIKKHTQ